MQLSWRKRYIWKYGADFFQGLSGEALGTFAEREKDSACGYGLEKICGGLDTQEGILLFWLEGEIQKAVSLLIGLRSMGKGRQRSSLTIAWLEKYSSQRTSYLPSRWTSSQV